MVYLQKKLGKMKNKKNILILGGGGYLGQSLVELLSKKKYFRINVIDRFFYVDQKKLFKSKNIYYNKDDIRKLSRDSFKNINIVIDLSNISIAPKDHMFFDKMSWDINYYGRKNNLIYAREERVEKYLFPSSCSVYGFNDTKAFLNEKSKLNPKSTYAKTHMSFENFALKQGNDLFQVISLRLPTLFGYSKRMRFDLIINSMVWDVLEKKTINLLRDGKQRRPFVHVDDVSRAFLFFINNKSNKFNNNIFNIGNNMNNINLLNLAKKIFKVLGIKENIVWYGKSDDRSYFVSFNKISKFGFKPKKSIDYGIRELKRKYLSKELINENFTKNMVWLEFLENLNKSKKLNTSQKMLLKNKKLYNGILKLKKT